MDLPSIFDWRYWKLTMFSLRKQRLSIDLDFSSSFLRSGAGSDFVFVLVRFVIAKWSIGWWFEIGCYHVYVHTSKHVRFQLDLTEILPDARIQSSWAVLFMTAWGHRRCTELVLRSHHWSRSPPSWNNDFSAGLYRFPEPRMGGIQLGRWRKDVLVVLVRCHVSIYWVIRGVCHLSFGNRCQIEMCVTDLHVRCFETRGHIWNRKWLPQDPHYLLTIHHAVMTSQGLVERSHWESKYLLMLKPGGWSLFCATAIAIGWMMNWT